MTSDPPLCPSLQVAWQEATQQKVTLEESALCEEVFPTFLKSLYTMGVVLSEDNIIPLLMLYDKYLIKKHKDVRQLAISIIISICNLLVSY